MAKHADLTSIHLFAFTGADPGAVGAGKAWIDASGATPVLKVRNAGDTGWDTVGGGTDTEAVQDIVGALIAGAGGTYNDAAGTITLPGGLTVAEVDGTPSIAATTLQVPNGQLTNPSGAIARLDAAPTVHTHAAADVTSGVLAMARLATGTPNGAQFVRDDGTLAVPAGTGMANPMTTQDDLIVGGAAGAPARLAKGTDGQVLTVDSGTHHLAWATPAAGGAAAIGYLPWAYQPWFPVTAAPASVLNLAAGTVLLAPILVAEPLTLDGVTARNGDTSATRQWTWALYREPAGGGATLDRVAQATGNDSFTASSPSNRTLAAASAPVALGAGLYWLACHNNGANAFQIQGVSIGAGSAGMLPNCAQIQTGVGSLGATLVATGAWTKTTDLYCLRLNGRVFAQATPF